VVARSLDASGWQWIFSSKPPCRPAATSPPVREKSIASGVGPATRSTPARSTPFTASPRGKVRAESRPAKGLGAGETPSPPVGISRGLAAAGSKSITRSRATRRRTSMRPRARSSNGMSASKAGTKTLRPGCSKRRTRREALPRPTETFSTPPWPARAWRAAVVWTKEVSKAPTSRPRSTIGTTTRATSCLRRRVMGMAKGGAEGMATERAGGDKKKRPRRWARGPGKPTRGSGRIRA
jgi:hypothetical protein